MIISDRRKKPPFPRTLAAGLLLLLLALAAPSLYRWAMGRWGPQGVFMPGVLTCSAEYRQGMYFREGPYLFDNGRTQSRARARTGRHSSRLLPGEGLQFGMGVRVQNLQAGGLYQASVWRYQNPGVASHIVARTEGGKDPFYLTQGHPSERDENGWEQLRLRFFIPFQDLPRLAQVYLYSEGKDTVYFDDFELRLLHTFQEGDLDLPRIDLNIPEEALRRLEEKRIHALKSGILETGPDDWVKGKIFWKELSDPISANLRLKGDWLDHLGPEKWSYRVSLAEGHFRNGFRTFSLQDPGTRYYLHEWLLHEAWKRVGVLTTDYDFADLRLNGKSSGLYAVEEHFERYLPERQGRREGPILKLDESGFWDGLRRQIALTGKTHPDLQLPSSRPANAAIGLFQPSRAADTLARNAGALLDQFRQGARPAGELFDLDILARFYALADVWDAHHSTSWHNLRFYYNPATDRLEPVGFDGYGTGPSDRGAFLIQGYSGPPSDRPWDLQDMLFLDTAFVAKYMGYLHKYSHPAWLNEFLQETAAARLPRELALLQEYPQYAFLDQEFIQSVQKKRVMLFPQDNYAFEIAASGTELRNLHTYPLLLLGYAGSDGGDWTPFPAPQWFPAAPDRPLWMEIRTDSSGYWKPLDHFKRKAGALEFGKAWGLAQQAPIPAQAKWLVYRLPGVDTIFRQAYRPNLQAADMSPRQELFDKPFPENDPRWTVSQRSIRFHKGRQLVSEMLAIPAGYTVEAGPGVVLDFVKGGGLVSQSPVFFAGSPDEPVLVTSSDGTGRGFTVLAPQGRSSVKYAVFEKLRPLDWKGWTLPGAVTFNGGAVEMQHCLFRNTDSEDGLNIVQAEVDISNCYFEDLPSDGFDCDFCTGVIQNAVFRRCQNDGLDISGSRLRVESCHFSECGDKGFSIGEASDVALFGAVFQDCYTALAVKDQSVAIADQLTIRDCGTGFVVYQKKPEFGPGSLVVREYTVENTGRLYLLQRGSTLQLGRKLIRGADKIPANIIN